MLHLAAIGIALDRDLLALEHALGDQAGRADVGAGMALEQPLERQEELIELRPAALEPRQARHAMRPSAAPIEKNDFTGLTKAGRKHARREVPRCSATSMGRKGGTASGTMPGLRHARQIFVLADQI